LESELGDDDEEYEETVIGTDKQEPKAQSLLDETEVVESDEPAEDTPLPTEDEVNEMLSEIRSLETDDSLLEEQMDEPVMPKATKDELQAILSSIPSFSSMSKKKK
jgi:hypothetical protein